MRRHCGQHGGRIGNGREHAGMGDGDGCTRGSKGGGKDKDKGRGGRLKGYGWRWGPWEFAVHGNGSDAGRSRLTFRPLARCSRGAFINSSVLIPRIDEWPPIAIPCAPYSAGRAPRTAARLDRV